MDLEDYSEHLDETEIQLNTIFSCWDVILMSFNENRKATFALVTELTTATIEDTIVVVITARYRPAK